MIRNLVVALALAGAIVSMAPAAHADYWSHGRRYRHRTWVKTWYWDRHHHRVWTGHWRYW